MAAPEFRKSDKYTKHSVQDYTEVEEYAGIRYEYHAGKIIPAYEKDFRHTVLASKINFLLLLSLKHKNSDCQVYNNQAKIAIKDYHTYLYPDAVALNTHPNWDKNLKHAFDNPLLVVEVVSRLTTRYDHNYKFELYRSLSSLREYVLVEVIKPQVEVHFRKNEKANWEKTVFRGLQSEAYLKSLDIKINLAELFENLKF